MKRILLMVAYNILLVPVMWFKLCYYAKHTEKYTEEERYKMLRFIDRRAIKGGRIVIDIHGQENIPEKDGFMSVSYTHLDVYKRQVRYRL